MHDKPARKRGITIRCTRSCGPRGFWKQCLSPRPGDRCRYPAQGRFNANYLTLAARNNCFCRGADHIHAGCPSFYRVSAFSGPTPSFTGCNLFSPKLLHSLVSSRRFTDRATVVLRRADWSTVRSRGNARGLGFRRRAEQLGSECSSCISLV